MASSLIGFLSGGQPLCSGNPVSGNFNVPSTVKLKLSKEISGYVYVGFGPGFTVNSGLNYASGGLQDGIQLSPGDSYNMNVQPSSGPGAIWAQVSAATVSGTMRLYWDTNP